MQRHVVILHYKKNYATKVPYFPKIYNHTSLYGSVASGPSVDPTSEVLSSAMFVLLTVRSWKTGFYGKPQRHNVNTKFNSN
jgi:hypothetical protein